MSWCKISHDFKYHSTNSKWLGLNCTPLISLLIIISYIEIENIKNYAKIHRHRGLSDIKWTKISMTVAICSFYTQRHTHSGRRLHDIDSVLLRCEPLTKSAPVSSVFEQTSFFSISQRNLARQSPNITNLQKFLIVGPESYCVLSIVEKRSLFFDASKSRNYLGTVDDYNNKEKSL
jgi:hypothetical protein